MRIATWNLARPTSATRRARLSPWFAEIAADHYYGSRRNRAALTAALNEAELTSVTTALGDPITMRTGGRFAMIDHLCLSPRLLATVKPPPRAWPETGAPDRALTDHFGIAVDLV